VYPSLARLFKVLADGSAEVSLEVTDLGRMKGDEIDHLSLRELVSLLTRLVMDLKDSARGPLRPGRRAS
jgi:hypothetical protein